MFSLKPTAIYHWIEYKIVHKMICITCNYSHFGRILIQVKGHLLDDSVVYFEGVGYNFSNIEHNLFSLKPTAIYHWIEYKIVHKMICISCNYSHLGRNLHGVKGHMMDDSVVYLEGVGYNFCNI